MIYDKAEWHYGGNFPKDLPKENGITHIGMYICWIIDNDLVGNFHIKHSKENLEKLRNRKITGRQFLIESCDEVLTDEDLNSEGNKFSKYYYADKDYKDYVYDYAEVFNQYDILYQVEDTWENYEKLKKVLDKKYEEWLK